MIEHASLIVLAGGKSKRMGIPKSLLRINGKLLLEYIVDALYSLFDDILLVVKEPPYPVSAYYRIIFDKHRESSPLVGIFAGLKEAYNQYSLVVGGDMPFVVPSLVASLLSSVKEEDVIVPIVNGFYEPLLAIYNKRILDIIERRIKEGNFKVSSLYEEVYVREVPESQIRREDPALLSFLNMNTPRDLDFLNLPFL